MKTLIHLLTVKVKKLTLVKGLKPLDLEFQAQSQALVVLDTCWGDGCLAGGQTVSE
jgi:hypothetical protein